jgi:hypothetical protein
MNAAAVFARPAHTEQLVNCRHRRHLHHHWQQFSGTAPHRSGTAQNDARDRSRLLTVWLPRATAALVAGYHPSQHEVISFATIAMPGEINMSHSTPDSGRSHDQWVTRNNGAGQISPVKRFF